MRLSSTIEIYGGGQGSGCNPAVGTCGRKPKPGSKEAFRQEYLQKHPEHEKWLTENPNQLETLYRKEKYGNLNTLQQMAKESGEDWEESKSYSTGASSRAKTWTKDLGHHGKIQLHVIKSSPTSAERVRVEVSHGLKSSGKYQQFTVLHKEAFGGDSADSQAEKYLQSRWGIKYTPPEEYRMQ